MGNRVTRFVGFQRGSQPARGRGGGFSRGAELSARASQPPRGSGGESSRGSGAQEWTGYEEEGKPQGVDLGADIATFEEALRVMAGYLACHNQDLTIITVGGPINTLLLKEQRTRQHLDYLGIDFGSQQRKIFREAARYAESRCSGTLGDAWFNKPGNEPLTFPRDVSVAIIGNAINQNEIVFQARGLTILAAPWDYAFCASLSRLTLGHPSLCRPYELSDAIAYLRRYIETHGDRQVSIQQIQSWARTYGTSLTETMARYVSGRYRIIYKRDGVVDAIDNIKKVRKVTFTGI